MDFASSKLAIFRPTLKKIITFSLLLFLINTLGSYCLCLNVTLDYGGYVECPCGPFSFISRLSIWGMGPRNPFDYLLIQIPILYVFVCLVIYGFKKMRH